MPYTLPEPYYDPSTVNLTKSIPNPVPPEPHDPSPVAFEVEEKTPLLSPKKQRIMGRKGELAEFGPLDQCNLARMSECSDDTLGAAFQGLIGLQDARVFQVVDVERQLPLYYTRETASCCERNCFPGRCRPEHTEIYQANGNKVAQMDRSCCGGSVNVVDNRGKRLGYISNHLSCSRLMMTVSITSTKNKYTVSTDRWGLVRWLGKLPFGSCRSIKFTIMTQDHYPVAFISNEWTGILRELLTDADDYFLEFGHVSNPDDKLLLLATAIFIDSLYFSGMCSNWTIRTLLLKYFNPVAKVQKAAKVVGTLAGPVYRRV
eukprot:Protomagalhaensia_sp_Gyna_25__2671@NODE_2526_length_1035_cov_75_965863_g2094_i0_p1_GENE_NODE_2526_length_1035_cov_75_965863_g2094_i0NODE_2526_length_1035_cov_75_965863_g2094_i0_p1_ORF_typecomplete_len328_score33_83Scramblase/PF03803_15/1_8e33_NODE_2526_length_1035_cov_75_965863_g2094_i034984